MEISEYLFELFFAWTLDCFIYILDSSNSFLVSSHLALEATKPLSEPLTQMAVELINIHLVSVQQKRLV